MNVGSVEEISIQNGAERVRQMTTSSSSIQTVSYDDAYEAGFEDMLRRVPDIGKVERLVQWRPSRSLDDILRDVIWFERSN